MPRRATKPVPPSLRDYVHPIAAPAVRGVPREIFERLLAPGKSSQEARGLEIWMAEAFIVDCERKGLADEAAGLRTRLRQLEQARAEGNIDAAIVEALCLGRGIVTVIRDAAFANAVAAHKSSTRHLRNRPTVTDDQIREAMTRHRTQAAASDALGIGVRQLRDRLRDMGVKRKSVRLPTRK